MIIPYTILRSHRHHISVHLLQRVPLMNLIVAVLNVCSLHHKISELCAFINDTYVDIIGLAESWLNDTIADGYVQILKFTLICRDRPGPTGGGVCFYYKSSLAVSRWLDLEDSCLESLVISAKTRKGNPSLLTLALYYIPRSAPRNVWDTLGMSLETLCTKTPSRLLRFASWLVPSHYRSWPRSQIRAA